MIECIQSSGWTGYVLMKVRDDLLEVGFVKVPRDDTCSAEVESNELHLLALL